MHSTGNSLQKPDNAAGGKRWTHFSFLAIRQGVLEMKASTFYLALSGVLACILAPAGAHAQSPYSSSADFAKYAMKLRESALLKIEPQVVIPTANRPSIYSLMKKTIVTTIFWVGERPTANNPVPNNTSSWDPDWQRTFGGFDNPDPSARRNYIPIAFTPKENPFYCALPYNDVTHGETKPEAPSWIPWFKETYKEYGKSVCRNRWVAIKKGNRVCYAQWSDCGPFRTDHVEYVFGNDRPKWNLNRGAGLDVSPAVRDYLGLAGTDVTDWKFVDFQEIPPGPWALYGDNNDFVLNARRSGERVVSKAPIGYSPTVITR
jgi:hypothetical protein